MKPFSYETEKKPARVALNRQAKPDDLRPGSYHPVDGTGAARTPFLDGLTSNAHFIAQRSLIQLQQNCGNQCVQRSMALAPKNEDEMIQAKVLGNPINRQAEERPEEEEPLQTKQANGEIQRQPEEEEEKKPV